MTTIFCVPGYIFDPLFQFKGSSSKQQHTNKRAAASFRQTGPDSYIYMVEEKPGREEQEVRL